MTRDALKDMLFRYFGLTGTSIKCGATAIHNAYLTHIAKLHIEKNKLEAELTAYKAKIDELKEWCGSKRINLISYGNYDGSQAIEEILQKLEELDK